MKPKVLLAGGTGYIGRYLSRVIEHDAQLFALSKYPKPDKGSTNKITWLKRDIYNHKDVVEATVVTENINAIELFKGMGFQIEGELKDKLFINQKYYNEYVMAKILN